MQPRGFTLIELLVVLGILSLLITALYPAITNALGAGETADTKSRLGHLATAIQAFEARYGVAPADDFTDVAKLGIEAKTDNGVNTGIESLVTSLSWKSVGAADLGEHPDWLMNLDGDDNGARIPRLGRTDRVEVVDAWGIPFVYFEGNTKDLKGKRAQVRMPDELGGHDAKVKPFENPDSDGFLVTKGNWQLMSAGEDGKFGTADDITFPERPRG